ncbi:YchJ family protein, partial [Bradyrhizobium sp.]
MSCPCGSDLPLDRCCGPYLSGDATPPTAEALMRSRYTAYTRGDIGYIAATLAVDKRAAFDAAAARQWASR